MKSLLVEFACLISDAQFAFDRGEDSLGLKALRKAFALGRKGGYRHFVWWRPGTMARLAARALEEGIEVDYALKLIKRRKLFPENPPMDVEQWPWPVRVYTFGNFELEVDGEPAVFSRKVPEKHDTPILFRETRDFSREVLFRPGTPARGFVPR